MTDEQMAEKAYARALRAFKDRKAEIIRLATGAASPVGVTYADLDREEFHHSVEMVRARVAKMRRGWT